MCSLLSPKLVPTFHLHRYTTASSFIDLHHHQKFSPPFPHENSSQTTPPLQGKFSMPIPSFYCYCQRSRSVPFASSTITSHHFASNYSSIFDDKFNKKQSKLAAITLEGLKENKFEILKAK
jgi:hypothetical protein